MHDVCLYHVVFYAFNSVVFKGFGLSFPCARILLVELEICFNIDVCSGCFDCLAHLLVLSKVLF